MHADPKRRLLPPLLGIVACFLLGSLLLADAKLPADSAPLVLVGGRVLTQTDAGPVEGTILIRDGTIVAVGRGVTIPDGATRIDVSGCVITPGLIDARSTLGLAAAEGREGAADGSLDILDGVDPQEEDWKEVIRQGVTAVYVQPPNSGLLGGRGAVLRVGPAAAIEDLVVKSGAGAQAALGTTTNVAPAAAAPAGFPRRGGGGPPPIEPDQPTTPAPAVNNSLTRFAQYEQLKRAFEAAKKYDEERTKQEEADKKKETPPAKANRGNPAQDFLRRVVKGEVPLRLEAHREDDVRNALRLADEFKLRVVLDGVSNAGAAAEGIASRRLPLVLGPFVELEEPPAYRKDRPADWPKALLTPESRWALGTFSSQPRGSRLLRVHAAAAVAQGIEADRVLRAMTRDAADLLGVGDRLGTIAAGKQADLAVFAGDPLDPAVPVRLVVSAGKVVFQDQVKPEPNHPSANGTPQTGLEFPARLPKKYALKTQRLLGDDGIAQPGLVLVDNGKVAGLGADVAIGDGVSTYDLGSAVLTPGLVAGPNTLGLAGMIDDPAEADAGQVRAADAYDPKQRQIRELLAGGFTCALLVPGSANVIGGTACGVRFGAAEPFLGDAGVKVVLTANSRGGGRTVEDPADDPMGLPLGRRTLGPARYPGSLAGQVELIEQVLNGKGPGTELYLPRRVREQIQAERRRQVVGLREKKQVAYFEAHTRAEVAAALQLIGRFELRGVLVGPEEITPFLDEIKRLGVGVVARPVQVGDYDRPALELARSAPAGVPVAFGSGSAQELRITAALAINAGLPREVAWHGLTGNAGQILGLPPSAGRLAVGVPADLVVWNGSPLDLRSRALRVVVDGKVAYAAP
jgi:imidazolonepropionase-like amidohydrolase